MNGLNSDPFATQAQRSDSPTTETAELQLPIYKVLSHDDKHSRAVAELLSTEKTFVKELKILVDIFLGPLRRWCKALESEYEAAAEEGEPVETPFTEDELNVIFSNVEQLLAFNTRFLADLEAAHVEQGTAELVEVFLKAAPFFKMYSSYINNFDKARDTLLNARQHTATNAFIKACEFQHACHGLQLPDFLIQPVQRIPRYRLLLETILKYTAANDPLLPRLEQALQESSSVATKINKDVHTREAQDKMLQLQAEFGNNEVFGPGRVLLREGSLIKVTRNGPKEHKFVLFNDRLLYGEENNFNKVRGMFTAAKKQYKKSRGLLLERGMYIVSDVSGGYGGGRGSISSPLGDTGFMVLTPDKCFVAVADSPAEKDAWVTELRGAMEKLTNAADVRANHQVEESSLSEKVKTARTGKIMSAELAVWVLGKDKKLLCQGFTLPSSALGAPYGVLTYSELTTRTVTTEPSTAWHGRLGPDSEWGSVAVEGGYSALGNDGDDETEDGGGVRLETDVPVKPGVRIGMRLRDVKGGGVIVVGFTDRESPVHVAGVLIGDFITHAGPLGTLPTAVTSGATLAAMSSASASAGVPLHLCMKRGLAPLSTDDGQENLHRCSGSFLTKNTTQTPTTSETPNLSPFDSRRPPPPPPPVPPPVPSPPIPPQPPTSSQASPGDTSPWLPDTPQSPPLHLRWTSQQQQWSSQCDFSQTMPTPSHSAFNTGTGLTPQLSFTQTVPATFASSFGGEISRRPPPSPSQWMNTEPSSAHHEIALPIGGGLPPPVPPRRIVPKVPI